MSSRGQVWEGCGEPFPQHRMAKIELQLEGCAAAAPQIQCGGGSTASARSIMRRLFLLLRFSASSALYSRAWILVCREWILLVCSATVSSAWQHDSRDLTLSTSYLNSPTSSCTASTLVVSMVTEAWKLAIAARTSAKPGRAKGACSLHPF